MQNLKSLLAAFCAMLMIVTPVSAQSTGAQAPIVKPGGMFGAYKSRDVALVNGSNSSRLEALMRAGNIYLSLQDTIALALENNLDIEIQRYGPRIALAELLRAKSGIQSRPVNTGVSAGPSSAAGNPASSPGLSSLASGYAITSGGVSPPSFDPIITSTVGWGHQTAPQVNPFVVGTTALVTESTVYNAQVAQGFTTGGTATLSLTNHNSNVNSSRYNFNPSTTSALSLNVNQPLLQGFGRALNTRYIIMARNNIKVSDLVFKQQLISTISTIVDLYWDLVSYNEDVKVKRQALALSEKLYNDNKKQVEIGTLAPIEIVRAEAEVASSQQDLTVSETNVLEQETIIKNVLSRTGMANPAVAAAHIIPTDHVRVPETQEISPLPALMGEALNARPEIAQNNLTITNSEITLKASKNGLLPSLNAYATVTNNALAGQVNALAASGSTTGVPAGVDSYFIGGYGTVLGQLFRRNFPDYSVGVQLNVPLRNRAAQADLLSSQLQLRQEQLNKLRMVNQIRVEVQNALIAVQQARARYQAAVKNRILAEETYAAERKKYDLGASTIFLVIQTQRDLTAAQSTEVTAVSNYIRAQVEMERSTGRTLTVNNIDFQEASSGVVSRPPAMIPAVAGK